MELQLSSTALRVAEAMAAGKRPYVEQALRYLVEKGGSDLHLTAGCPQDRFSGKALIYRPAVKGYLLYSVGPNGKDEGGQGYGDMPPGDDQSVRMPPSQPRK